MLLRLSVKSSKLFSFLEDFSDPKLVFSLLLPSPSSLLLNNEHNKIYAQLPAAVREMSLCSSPEGMAGLVRILVTLKGP